MDVESSSQPPPEERMNQHLQEPEKKRRQRFWILMATIVALMIGIIVMAVTLPGVSKDKTDANSSLALNQQQQGMSNTTTSSPTEDPATNMPTMSPTMLPTVNSTKDRVPVDSHDDNDEDDAIQKPTTTAEFQQDLLLALSNETSYLGESYSPDSYMGKALAWMLEEDSQYYPVDKTLPIVLLERFILAAMYFALGGPTWQYEWEPDLATVSTNFLKNTSVCEWIGDDYMDDQGVFCDEETSRVSAIYLGHIMEGNFFTEITFLPDLKTLDWCGNKITGSLPTEIGTMTSLTSLFLCVNQFTGTLPSELGNLSNLRVINMGANTLTGTLPTELGRLENLAWLEFYTNDLSGTIPSEIGTMSSLREVAFRENFKLSGSIPTEIGRVSTMEDFSADECNLRGTIPTEIGLLSSLESFSVSKNALSGTIPSEMGLLTNLGRTYLSFNNITGPVPSELGLLTRLGYVEFQETLLTGTVPNEVCAMRSTSLERLIVDCTPKPDTGFVEIECLVPDCCTECH